MTYQRQTNEQELKISNLTLDNLPDYLKRMLKSEKMFHPELREDEEGFRDVLSSHGSTGKLALLGKKYIGNALGCSPTIEQITDMELLGVNEDPSMIYLTNYAINANFQNRGHGTELLRQFAEECKRKGYKILEAHFRNSSSIHIAKNIGSVVIEEFPDWFNTGEPYTHCRLNLT